MRNLRRHVKNAPVIGHVLHGLYLRAFYQEAKVLTISGGPLVHKRWVRFMHTHNDRYVSGDYEQAVQMAIVSRLKPGMTFFDVGANAGFFSLLGATLVGQYGKVIAFEPHPVTAKQLRKQMAVNLVNNVSVVQAAVCDRVGTDYLSNDTYSVMASLDRGRIARDSLLVNTTTLDHELASRRVPVPDLLKIDVEGAEIEVLRGAKDIITQQRPTLLVEVHSSELAVAYDSAMMEFGYTTRSLAGSEISVAQSGERFVVSTPR